jgi:hypothetical protein
MDGPSVGLALRCSMVAAAQFLLPARCPPPRPRVRVSGCTPRWKRRILSTLEAVPSGRLALPASRRYAARDAARGGGHTPHTMHRRLSATGCSPS